MTKRSDIYLIPIEKSTHLFSCGGFLDSRGVGAEDQVAHPGQ